MEGFSYPNELHIPWGPLIVVYPYITGLVAGAFVVSALYHVFGVKQLEKVSRLALLAALSFLVVAPIALNLHLGHPERGVEIFFTPNPTSAMAGFGYIWLFYFLLLVTEVWLVFRKDIVANANASKGWKRLLYRTLALGVLEIPEGAAKLDEKLIKILATVGIPSAALLHGYVGFIFGSVKANPWWSTPLMPIIFLLSAIVSGIAMLVIVYPVTALIRKQPVDRDCINSLAGWLLGFLLIASVVEGLEVISMLYESEENLEVIVPLITNKLRVSYLIIQLGMGTLLPALVLGIIKASNIRHHVTTAIQLGSAGLILIGVLAMRWNVVIGGQLVSKSLRGFNEFEVKIWGEEGIALAAAFLVLPLIIFAVLVFILPPWKAEAKPEETRKGTRWGTFGSRQEREIRAQSRVWR